MKKYRKLTKTELENLKDEFIEFLSVQTITGEEWKTIKEEEPEKADEIIAWFSEVMYEQWMRRVNFAVKVDPKSITAFRFTASNMVLISIQSTNGNIDLTQTPLAQIDNEALKSMEVYTSTKKYTKSREEEIFDLVEKGCLPDDGKYFKTLIQILPD
ncbi:DUF6495 family protein [Marinigracilibium pacificum]|uniref:Uncharacterized protein n=1 Tax=Marinigracilibium pacificum TaxID=2729599 RepID=A0A848J6I9_9BACT|nr:DUF6495 family protein [Marinigracilibium pacificum]NMM49999.1 hypothetical protein [Marinigracilibium pacificum]